MALGAHSIQQMVPYPVVGAQVKFIRRCIGQVHYAAPRCHDDVVCLRRRGRTFQLRLRCPENLISCDDVAPNSSYNHNTDRPGSSYSKACAMVWVDRKFLLTKKYQFCGDPKWKWAVERKEEIMADDRGDEDSVSSLQRSVECMGVR